MNAKYPNGGCKYYLTIGCVFQDEARYLKEWIEYHKIIGVQHFVLVDDRSTDNYLDVLEPYIESGEVQLFRQDCPEALQGRDWPEYQCAVHCALVSYLRGLSQWVALIDTDEFIVVRENDRLTDFLRGYEDRGGIYIRWEPFGTSHVDELSDEDLLTERLNLKARFRSGEEMLGKSIVNPFGVKSANIHKCELFAEFSYFDSNPRMLNELPPIKLYHYWCRDKKFLVNVKLPRSSKIKGWKIDEDRVHYFLDLYNEIPDHTMGRFAERLRAKMLQNPRVSRRKPACE